MNNEIPLKFIDTPTGSDFGQLSLDHRTSVAPDHRTPSSIRLSRGLSPWPGMRATLSKSCGSAVYPG